VSRTSLDGVLDITPPTIFNDFRGSYIELYNEPLYRAAGIRVKFIQDDISTSSRHVLRGIHGDAVTWKLISCLYGRFRLMVVNANPRSRQYGKWASFELSDRNRRQVLVPPRFGNGHVVLSDVAIFHYKQTTIYDRAGQFTILWNDPRFGFRWPVKRPILSTRDTAGDGTGARLPDPRQPKR
jgi:dTDP-4-dehydrorhamnose 3,5-epimerase